MLPWHDGKAEFGGLFALHWGHCRDLIGRRRKRVRMAQGDVGMAFGNSKARLLPAAVFATAMCGAAALAQVTIDPQGPIPPRDKQDVAVQQLFVEQAEIGLLRLRAAQERGACE